MKVHLPRLDVIVGVVSEAGEVRGHGSMIFCQISKKSYITRSSTETDDAIGKAVFLRFFFGEGFN